MRLYFGIIRMDYKDLDVWQKCRQLVSKVYTITKEFPSTERYGLISQINRSSISVASNIAEGCGRRTSKETLPFLYISRGSLYELETQLILSLDQKFIEKAVFDYLNDHIIHCKKLLQGFINYHLGR